MLCPCEESIFGKLKIATYDIIFYAKPLFLLDIIWPDVITSDMMVTREVKIEYFCMNFPIRKSLFQQRKWNATLPFPHPGREQKSRADVPGHREKN